MWLLTCQHSLPEVTWGAPQSPCPMTTRLPSCLPAATEGGLYSSKPSGPYFTLNMAPAERYEVLVDFADATGKCSTYGRLCRVPCSQLHPSAQTGPL